MKWQFLALGKSPALEKKLNGKQAAHVKAYRERLRGTETHKERLRVKREKKKAVYRSLTLRQRKRLLARDLASRKRSQQEKRSQETAGRKA